MVFVWGELSRNLAFTGDLVTGGLERLLSSCGYEWN